VSNISSELNLKTEIEVVEKSSPAYTPEDSLLVTILKESIRRTLNIEPRTTICVGGLDLRYYTAVNIPAVAYGPGTVGLAHKPDEYIELSDIAKSISVYVDFIKRIEEHVYRTS